MSAFTRFLAGGAVAALALSVPAHAVEGLGAGVASLTFTYSAPDADGCRSTFTLGGTIDGAIVLAGVAHAASYAVTGVPGAGSYACVDPADSWVLFDAHLDGIDQDGHAVDCYVGAILAQPDNVAALNGSCTVDGGPAIHLDASLRGTTIAGDGTLDFRGAFLSGMLP